MLLQENIKKEVRKQFQNLKKPVRIIVFTQKMECQFCKDTHSLMEELAELSDKISIEVYDFIDNTDKAKEYGIDKIPGVVIAGEKDFGIKFYGIPGGYEFTSLIEAVTSVSMGEADLENDTRTFLDSLTEDIHLQVFVTPTCPYCPRAVILAHHMALYSDKVKADMVEVTEFPHLGNKYQVQGVPRTVINETEFAEGAVPEGMMVEKIKAAMS